MALPVSVLPWIVLGTAGEAHGLVACGELQEAVAM